ncbi:hypothetical protein MMC30_007012 [Trapelia coarctata]|nr:hypothetical protein [Trapelia coarctata]
MTSFLSLPLEVRQMIYSYALVVGNVYPYRKTQELKYSTSGNFWPEIEITHPAVRLLSTCRLIRQEAEPLLYGQNTVNLPVRGLAKRFFDSALHSHERRYWVKRVCVRFRSDDLEFEERVEVLWPLTISILASLARRDTDDMLEVVVWDFGSEVHDALKKRLYQSVWPRKIRPIIQHLKLDSITLDFDECYCTDRCCELAGYATSAFMPGFVHGMPKSVEINDPYDMTNFTERHRGVEGIVKKLMRGWTAERLRHLRDTENSDAEEADAEDGDVGETDTEKTTEDVADKDTAKTEEALRYWLKSEERVSERWFEGSWPQNEW